MTGLSLDDADRARLASAYGVREQPDGSLRNDRGTLVEPGTAAGLLNDLAKGQPDPSDIRRPYITAGHAADSSANRRTAAPVPPEGGGRSASLCTTPPDDDGPGDGNEVEKVVAARDFDRGFLTAGHAAPSPDDAGDNNPIALGTANGPEVYQNGTGNFNSNAARERSQHVAGRECVSQPAPAQYKPPADLGARNVPVPASPGRLTGRAPGER